jgi:hypothetical protein
MDELMVVMMLVQWVLSVTTMAAGIGGGVYVGQWLWARYAPRTRRR